MTEAVRRILAVDFGDARTGLAATDWTGAIGVPLGRIDARDDAAVVAAIADMVRERDTQVVVLGMPLTVDGTPGQRAVRTAAFRARLQAALRIPVEAVDESDGRGARTPETGRPQGKPPQAGRRQRRCARDPRALSRRPAATAATGRAVKECLVSVSRVLVPPHRR